MRISIVTPSFNQSEFVSRTVDSVLSQKDDDTEYIVVDGNSSDGSVEILRAYEEQLDKLIVEADDGQADAINKGFRASSGEILAYLNSDDVLLPGTIQFVRDYFKSHPSVDVLYSHRIFIDTEDRIHRFWILPPHTNYCMKRWDFIPQECCFWRRSIMEEVGGIDTSYDFAIDYDLFVRMMNIGRFKRVHRYLAMFREHGKSKTSRLLESLGHEEIDKVRNRYGLKLQKLDRVVGKLFWMLVVYPSAVYRRIRIPKDGMLVAKWLKRRRSYQSSFPY